MTGGEWMRKAAMLALVFGLAGCAALPAAGPATLATSTENSIQSVDGVDFAVVHLTREITERLPKQTRTSLSGAFAHRSAPRRTTIGVGDTVAITVFEATAGGLFIPGDAGSRPGNYVQLPSQQVDQTGKITVPFAGTIAVAGRATAEVESEIENRLKSRAIEPHVVVAVTDRQSTGVSVIGDVNQPVRYVLTPHRERLLDALARAQGPKYPDYETFVTLQRGSTRAKVLLRRLITDPAENIELVPNDTLYVSHEPRYFMAFGASGNNGRFPLENDKTTLADAVGQAGGLLDTRADPASVLLYRTVPKKVLEASNIAAVAALPEDAMVPTVFVVNLREVGGYFLAQQFAVQEHDIIYVSTAASVEMNKALDLLYNGASTGYETRLAIKGR